MTLQRIHNIGFLMSDHIPLIMQCLEHIYCVWQFYLMSQQRQLGMDLHQYLPQLHWSVQPTFVSVKLTTFAIDLENINCSLLMSQDFYHIIKCLEAALSSIGNAPTMVMYIFHVSSLLCHSIFVIPKIKYMNLTLLRDIS